MYFDDFKVEHVKSPVIESSDYYPFGLTFNSYQRENSLVNRKKFQSQEHIEDLGLNWDSFKWRNHQPDIGRFFNVDPLSEKYYYNSPYAFSENKVVAHREVEGLEAESATSPQAMVQEAVDTFIMPLVNLVVGAVTGDKQLSNEGIQGVTPIIPGFTGTMTQVNAFLEGRQLTTEESVTVTLDQASFALAIGLGEAAAAGKTQARTSEPQTKPPTTGPTEPYNRSKHYGKTPKQSDRNALGAKKGEDVDHNVPLVEHYWEGDRKGSAPGYSMTNQERRKFANDRSNMTVKPQGQNRSDGGRLAKYSKEMKKRWGFD